MARGVLVTDHRSLVSQPAFRKLANSPASVKRGASVWQGGRGIPLRNMRSCKLGRFESGRTTVAELTRAELDARIAAIRQNISDLVEQAAAYSGAGDESRAADRIAQQEQELRRLTALRDKLEKQ